MTDEDLNFPAGNRRTIRDETGEELWESFTNEYADDGSLLRQLVANRDGSTVRSEFAAPNCGSPWDERHVVQLADGSITVFENAGKIQTAYDGDGKPITRLSGPNTWTHPAVLAGLVLYNWFVSRNEIGAKAI